MVIRSFNLQVFIVLSIFLTACQQTESQYIKEQYLDFPQVFELKSQEILPDEIGVIEANTLDTLLFLTINGGDDFFHIYSTALEPLGKFGKKGFGPNEFQAPVIIDQLEKSGNEVFIWINDKFRYTLSRINLTESLKQHTTIITNQIELEPELALSQEVIFLNDSIVVGNMGVESLNPYRLRYFNLNSGSTNLTEDLPSIDDPKKIKRGDYYTLFYSFIGIHPQKDKIVSALNYFNRLDIIDAKSGGTLERITEGSGHSEFNAATRVSNGQFLNLHNYYFDIDVTEELIFALYYDQPDSEYGDKMIPTQIRAFDWDGNPKFLIKVPDYLMNISIDAERKVMYGADYYNEKTYQYNLENIL